MAIRQQMAVAVSNTIWLPPLRASLPNMRIVTNKRVTNTSMGTKESKGEDLIPEVLQIVKGLAHKFASALIRICQQIIKLLLIQQIPS